jgi:hypothetical protein
MGLQGRLEGCQALDVGESDAFNRGLRAEHVVKIEMAIAAYKGHLSVSPLTHNL